MNTQAPATEVNPYAHLSVSQQKALETRKRRAPEYARQREVDKAMKLYSMDRMQAAKSDTQSPIVTDYLARDERNRSVATEWAKGRFGELKGGKQ